MRARVGTLQVIVDGQYGSCGKGAVAAHLAHPGRTPEGIAAVRVAGPNAGHSAVDPGGWKWALRQIPVAAVVNPDARLYIAAGSEIDIAVLHNEAGLLEAKGHKIYDRLTIDPMATIIESRHHNAEADADLVHRVGSTGKGIGAARADRIMRGAMVVRDTDLADLCTVAPVAPALHDELARGATVQLECAQGYGLGLHHANYPQVTSSDCRAIDFMAMAGVNPWDQAVGDLQIWLVFRPYPIRVAGNSGPMLDETSWEALGLPEERTTVTQKIRRVGGWDPVLAREATLANGGGGHTGGGGFADPTVRLALTMGDHIEPLLAGSTDTADLTDQIVDFIHMVEHDTGSAVYLLGTSDRSMMEL